MKEIPLTKGLVALIDDEDYDKVMLYKWYALIKMAKPYAANDNNTKSDGRSRRLMHRYILDVTDSNILVDHENGNTLDNTRKNIRTATRSDNVRNLNKLSAHNTSGFKGVGFNKKLQKWQPRIVIKNRSHHLGTFEDIRDAAKAYDEAALKIFGKFAKTNKMLGLL